ncbi:MAG: T9SS type A sorting domain-containing protein, partial [Bacteroidota bacterium]
YTEEEAGADGFAPQAGDIGLTLTCDSDATTPVRVYAIDANGNADYCSVFVLTQLFQPGLCTGNDGTVNGRIGTQDNGELANVEVRISGEGDMDLMTQTDQAGAYSFVGLPVDADYTVQPSHLIPVDLAMVTVADVVLIGNVILGAATFDSGYDYLAADVDQDQSLSVGDMVAIQRVILGLDNMYNTGESWGFVPADVAVDEPFAQLFPEVININDLSGNIVDADFVGFAYGDVNSVGRSSASLEVEDTNLEAGQTHTMVISGAELAGFQGTLELAPGLELINVSYEGEGGLNLEAAATGAIAMLFRSAATLNVEVRATEAGLLSELVDLTSSLTLAEGVKLNGTGGALNLAFVTNNAPASAQNALLQNTPNPVLMETIIGFELAESSRATLTIRDVAGRVITVKQLEASAGMNRVMLTKDDLNTTGVLTYTLVAGDFSATRKMVVLK